MFWPNCFILRYGHHVYADFFVITICRHYPVSQLNDHTIGQNARRQREPPYCLALGDSLHEIVGYPYRHMVVALPLAVTDVFQPGSSASRAVAPFLMVRPAPCCPADAAIFPQHGPLLAVIRSEYPLANEFNTGTHGTFLKYPKSPLWTPTRAIEAPPRPPT